MQLPLWRPTGLPLAAGCKPRGEHFARLLHHVPQALLLAAAVLLGGCTVAPTHPAWASHDRDATPLVPVRHFVADLDGRGGYQLSPDGKRLMWMARKGLGPGTFVMDLDTGSIRSYDVVVPGAWTRDSRHVLVHGSAFGNENTQLFRWDATIDGSPPQALTAFPGARSFLHSQLTGSADLLIQSNRRDAKVNDLYRWCAGTGQLILVARNPGHVSGWLTDAHTGQLLARTTRRGSAGEEGWGFEVAEGSGPAAARRECDGQMPEEAEEAAAAQEPVWHERFRLDEMGTVQILRLSADGQSAWALSNRGRDTLALVRISLADGSE